MTLRAMNNSQQNRQFGDDKRRTMARECHACQWQFACYGGCPKHRFYLRFLVLRIKTTCARVTVLFAHTSPTMNAMKTLYENGFSPAEIKSIFV